MVAQDKNNRKIFMYNVCLGAENIDFLLTDKKKIDIIKKIQSNENTNNIIYFGDGLTDKLAFEYVHNIGGTSVFICSNKKSNDTYEKLKVDGIIDECFNADFGVNSQISKYIQLRNLKNKEF